MTKTAIITKTIPLAAKRAALPARLSDAGRVRFGAGLGILPRTRG